MYVPAVKETMSSVVAVLLQRNEYGANPPASVKSIAPVLFPKQSTFVITGVI
jgi:hypothetical protein